MKISIGPYKYFVGPYQIAEALCFWSSYRDEYGIKSYPDWVHDFGTWLSGGKDRDSLLMKACTWIESKRHRKVKIHIDNYDTWNMCDTVSLVVLPMLKQLKEQKQGSPLVDLDDVPEHLRYTETEEYDAQMTFEFYDECKTKNITVNCDVHIRWEWVLDEMIWTFEQLQPDYDWESQYTIVPCEIDLDDYPEDEGKIAIPLRWKVKGEYDWAGMKLHEARIGNGLRLFGKYYQGLWS